MAVSGFVDRLGSWKLLLLRLLLDVVGTVSRGDESGPRALRLNNLSRSGPFQRWQPHAALRSSLSLCWTLHATR